MRDDHDHERVYVLRLWDETEPPHGCRISLYHAESGNRLYFNSLPALLTYLNSSTSRPDEPDEPHLQS